jgi:thiosulfate/3-mercaptopyruvate sulfurtransferase
MERRYPYGSGQIKLVSTQWLADHLTDQGLVVVDAQPNVHDYIQEHIPGAIYLNEGLFRTYEGALPTVWVGPRVAEEILGNAGIKNDTTVVVYGGVGIYKKWGDGLEQTMVAYTLARFGLASVFVLDGGIDRWKKEGRSLSQAYPAVKRAKFRASIQKDFFITLEEFLKIKDGKDVIVLDARPVTVYEGQGPWPKPGHIPGAINLPWPSLMDDANRMLLKSPREIDGILTRHGVTPDKTIICTCGTGREATNQFILLKSYLGFPKVKLYEGSFTEWAAATDRATVTGRDPR